MGINWENLPKQEGSKCGAYATLYYLIKIGVLGDELKEKLKKKANEIYNKVKFKYESANGSHPNKIVTYINTLLKEVDLYYLEKGGSKQVSIVKGYWQKDIVEDGIDEMGLEFKTVDGKLEDILKGNTNEKYAIGIYMPEGWKYNGANSLEQLHYMLTKKSEKDGKIKVINSNSPERGWIELKDTIYCFSGLLIKTKIE